MRDHPQYPELTVIDIDDHADLRAQDFERIYSYLSQRLVEANIKKDRDILSEVNGHLHSVRDTGKEVMRINMEQGSSDGQ